MSEYKFTVGEYLTRDGRKAVVLCDDAPGMWPLMGYHVSESGCSHPHGWTSDGRTYETRTSEFDLMPPAPPKPEPVERWVNLYLHKGSVWLGDLHDTEADAISACQGDNSLIRTIRISSEDTDRYAQGWDAAIEAALHALECAGFDVDGIAQPAVAYLKGKANA